mgnify:FL=1
MDNIELYLYRALQDKDITIANSLSIDLLSEAMSRVIATSGLNKTPYFVCYTEDPRIAIKYSKKEGYSGEIARIKVRLYDDGTIALVGDENAEVYRTWHMQDWLYLMKKSGWPQSAVNVNYTTSNKRLEDIITYQGRKAPRAYAHSDRGFIVHATSINYEILTSEKVNELSKIKVYRLKSYGFLKYDFTDNISQMNINDLIATFEKKNDGKAHTRIMLEQLKELVV